MNLFFYSLHWLENLNIFKNILFTDLEIFIFFIFKVMNLFFLIFSVLIGKCNKTSSFCNLVKLELIVSLSVTVSLIFCWSTKKIFCLYYIYIYIYNVWKTSQRSILRGVGSLRYNDTIQVKKQKQKQKNIRHW